MKEEYITEWIYKRRTSHGDQIQVRLPEKVNLDKGDYLIKIYKLVSEEK